MQSIAGVEFYSGEWDQTTVVDILVADILGVSLVDENHNVRKFGTLVNTIDVYNNQGRVSMVPTLGALWVVDCDVHVSGEMRIMSNYEVLTYDMRELMRAGINTYTFILYPHRDGAEIDLHALCEKPIVDTSGTLRLRHINVRPWVPTYDTTVCAFVQAQ